jgi:hypothetical protein
MAITDGSRPFEELLGGDLLGHLEGAQADQLLALRGLLAGEFSLLAHALQKRHLVDFGINRWGSKGLLRLPIVSVPWLQLRKLARSDQPWPNPSLPLPAAPTIGCPPRASGWPCPSARPRRRRSAPSLRSRTWRWC